VGVRGTVIEGFVDARGFEIYALLEGALDICTPLGCRALNTPGTFVVVSPGGVIGEPMAIPPHMLDSLLLPTPALNLVLEYFFTVLASGQDPLPQFRGLHATQNNQFAVPTAAPVAAPPTCPPKGEGHWGEGSGKPWWGHWWGEGSSAKGFHFASKGFGWKYGCPPKHPHKKKHHHHGGGDTE
jgi:hypothetical protein